MKKIFIAHALRVHIVKLVIAFTLFCVPALQAQGLDITVTVTDETCDGNGALEFNVENADPSAPVNYTVYLLPDTASPVSESSNTTLGGLQAGTYLVVASQTVNGQPVTGETEVTVEDEVEPLNYTFDVQNANCGSDGVITLNVISGTATSFELIAPSPVIRPLQPSNTFTGLPAGTYKARVIDDCNGGGIVKTIALFTDGTVLQLSGPSFPDTQLPACDLITIAYDITAQDPENGPINYPLDVTYTVYPPDGSTPVVFNSGIPGGEPEAVQAGLVIPFYYDTPYTVDITVTDPCGTVYSMSSIVQQKLTATLSFIPIPCGDYTAKLNVFKYGPPYTITFNPPIPEGFDPFIMNSLYPGPYSVDEVAFGDEDNPVPFGTYSYTIDDGCGRTFTETVEHTPPPPPEPEAAVYNMDCENNLGGTRIMIPSYLLANAYVEEAPEEYEHYDSLPYDVSAYIDEDGELQLSGLAPGAYSFTLIDVCENEYEIDIIVPDFQAGNPSAQGRPDCAEGFATVRVSPGNGSFTSVKISSAPPEFMALYSLPYDVSFNINEDGSFYMDGLLPGFYQFTTDTDCVTNRQTQPIPLYAYEVDPASSVSINRNCGSFDLSLNHISNGVAFVSFWLQQLLDAETGTWGSPVTGEAYEEGTEPTEENSILLTNNSTMYSIIHTGDFRVIKRYVSYGSGSTTTTKNCIEELYSFNFEDVPLIDKIINLSCNGTVADVEVVVEGAEPLTYLITHKNGESFIIDNGNNNTFYGLENAIYTVRVEDPCGYYVTRTFNVAELQSLVNATDPTALEACDIDDDNTETFDLSQQDAEILNGQSVNDVSLTYHSSLEDAVDGINPLPEIIDSGATTIFARVSLKTDSTCYDVASFPIILHEMPVTDLQDFYTACEGEEITITENSGFADYEWSTGEVTPSITIAESGDYTLTVTNDNGCTITKTISVAFAVLPEITAIEVQDWTEHDNVITVITGQPETENEILGYQYSIDGVNYQDSNIFTGVAPGVYLVHVKDPAGCGVDKAPAHVLTYPKFFTPNGDNINETWRVAYSTAEPGMMTYIYDRYGKVITGFDVSSPGWDGTLNGMPLPSTDYWFVIKRQDGKEYRGHFSLIR